jgi:hypothetical protein
LSFLGFGENKTNKNPKKSHKNHKTHKKQPVKIKNTPKKKIKINKKYCKN